MFRRSLPHIHAAQPHPHAHQIGMAAVIIALLGLPLAYIIVLPLTAIVLGITALALSRHPAPGMDARPESWVAIVTGLAGLIFGGAQLLAMIRIG